MTENNNKRIFLSPPHMGGYELEFVNEAFESNWIAPLGPCVDAFEREMVEYTGTSAAVALCSGTAAIHLALRLLNVSRGDIVCCSALTFVGSAGPILYQGARPVFIDSEPGSWNMSPAALSRALEDLKSSGVRPKAVIIVGLYGQSADMDPLLSICDAHGVPVIEDAAESLGATYRGRASGTFGKFGIYSFNGNKIITTSGGGMLVSDDVEAIEKARHWSSQARDRERYYQHSELGYNYRLSNLLAAVGRGQLKVLDERVKARRGIFDRYFEALGRLDGLNFMPAAPYGRPTRWLTVITVDPVVCGVNADKIIDVLNDDNIEARNVWKPLHRQPLFTGCAYYPHTDEESISDNLFEAGVCLPSGSNMTESDQERIIRGIKKLLSRAGGAMG